MIEVAVGLAVGFWGRQVYDMLKKLVDDLQYRREAKETGVVRPGARQVPRQTTESETGAIRSMTPEQFKMEAMKEREERAKNL